MDVLGFFCILGLIIFPISQVFQKGIDERLSNENLKRANSNNELIYYDTVHKCYRSTKTGQKAARYLARDPNGELYEYIVTIPLFRTITLGDLIEARYINIHKRNDPVVFDKYHKQLFFGGK